MERGWGRAVEGAASWPAPAESSTALPFSPVPPHPCTRPPPIRSGVFEDNVYCHITSGLGAGLFAVLCGSPVDVVKSRMMGACHSCRSPLCLGSLSVCDLSRSSTRAWTPAGGMHPLTHTPLPPAWLTHRRGPRHLLWHAGRVCQDRQGRRPAGLLQRSIQCLRAARQLERVSVQGLAAAFGAAHLAARMLHARVWVAV